MNHETVTMNSSTIEDTERAIWFNRLELGCYPQAAALPPVDAARPEPHFQVMP